ncbi:MAG TPA: tetratricopeptide repeat protein [Thermoanaerobaculia bacterium]|nr:tetratricopeptide repeat protein [Thermoanaerobaculia bacterium]
MAKPRPKAQPEKPEKPEKPGNTAPVPKRVARGADPALDAFTKALDAFHKKDWAKAAEQFETVVAQSDLLELTARARQYLAASRLRLEEAGGAKAKGKAKQEDGDPFLRAVFEKNRGESAAALELCRQEGRDKKDERFAYLAAAIHASEGRTEEAVEALSRAIELNPKNRVHAFHDPDFADLRRDHRQLFGLS